MKISKLIILLIFLTFISKPTMSKSLKINGLSQLSNNDIQAISNYDIYSDDYDEIEVNALVKKLYSSDLIDEVSFKEFDNLFIITVVEGKLIHEIKINGNIRINDEIIKSVIASKQNFFLNKSILQDDLSLIEDIYESKGFIGTSVEAKTEKYSPKKNILIFQINEGSISQLKKIKFVGNNSFTNRQLSSILNSSVRSFNFFNNSSNLSKSIFNLDKSKIINFYNDNGFNNVFVEYSLEKKSFANFELTFFLKENYRSKIIDLSFDLSDDLLNLNNFLKIKKKFEKDLSSNNNYYNFSLLNDFLIDLNDILLSKNITDKIIDVDIIDVGSDFSIIFKIIDVRPIIVNEISIEGNSLTKDNTLRSKFSIQPGDYLNKNKISRDIMNIKNLRYINDIKDEISFLEDDKANILFTVDENTKTGQLLLAGTANGDTGLGLSLGLSDDNLFGSGNSLKTSFNLNSDDAMFNIQYRQYLLSNPNLSNVYSIYNTESDLLGAFGYKTSSYGASYYLNYEVTNSTNSNIGIDFENKKAFSAINNSDLAITESLGKSENYKLSYNITRDTTNDRFYPNKGSINQLFFEYSPENISDDSFIKSSLRNSIFFKNKINDNFIFINNRVGIAESLDGNLKTKYAFNLGGMSFKGFDYRGIGPRTANNIYLGGNKYFTSTIGYGSTFLFDDKDNINFKLFYTAGSLWDGDYLNDNLKIRSSAGISLDILTPIGPLSFSYSMPVNKSSSDNTQRFNFSLGTSF